MSAKRFIADSGNSDDNDDQHHEKRLRPPPSQPAIGESLTVNQLHSLLAAMEPLLRKVVKEEVDRCLISQRPFCLRCCPSQKTLCGVATEQPSTTTLRLSFNTKLSLPIFTGNKICGLKDAPIEVHLVRGATSSSDDQLDMMSNTDNNYLQLHKDGAMRIDLVVVDGDFPGSEDWTPEQFNNSVVKERTGKRPLLTGDVSVMASNGVAVIGDIAFSDNSSWIRSRMFRIGARLSCVIPGIRVKEAVTEAFVVKDHRGELYKKHHPPMLDDEVWRLEKIGKDGVLHKKLEDAGIHSVQHFLALSVVDPAKLRLILGPGMSSKMWEATMKHARTCVLGTKLHIYRGHHFLLYFNPICQLLKAVINGQLVYPTSTTPQITTINRAYVENLVREAYANWKSLQKVEGTINDVPDHLLPQNASHDMVEQYPDNLLLGEILEQRGDHEITERHQNIANYDVGQGSVWHPISSVIM